ncbi:MAG: hypothetical protein ACOYI5_01270 [Christensenellales bacterium]|jgi:hypothetical protein
MAARFFHGAHKRRSYFEGWYVKQQNDIETVALIPAFHVDAAGQASASVQIITNERAHHIEYPASAFHADAHARSVSVGENVFSETGCVLRIDTPDLKVSGALAFGEFARPETDIMGPFRRAPFLECRHLVASFCHTVDGDLTINGTPHRFFGDLGYIEGDRGRSFPTRYVWTQCLFDGGSLMLSAADIPYLGMKFTGVIGFTYAEGREIRIATYKGARFRRHDDGAIVVRQGRYTLEITPRAADAQLLRAPVAGGMTRLIRENASCEVHYRLTDRKQTLFDFTSTQAGYEDNWRV